MDNTLAFGIGLSIGLVLFILIVAIREWRGEATDG